jgi:hypothetical protein
MALGKKINKEPEPERVPRNIKDLFKPSVELEHVAGFKIAAYGRAKVGKTHLAMTAPKPIYGIDTEGSWSLNRKQFSLKDQEQINVAQVLYEADKKSHKVDVVASLDAAFEAMDVLTDFIATYDGPIGTIVIDSGSDIWDWLGTWKDEQNFSEPGRLQWGHANKRYNEFIMMMLHSQWNVIGLFRAEAAVGGTGADLGYDKPKWQKKTDYWFDVILEMKYDGLTRQAIFKGDRFGGTHSPLTNPTWESIVKHLEDKTKIKVN